jgi:hypothetical protein
MLQAWTASYALKMEYRWREWARHLLTVLERVVKVCYLGMPPDASAQVSAALVPLRAAVASPPQVDAYQAPWKNEQGKVRFSLNETPAGNRAALCLRDQNFLWKPWNLGPGVDLPEAQILAPQPPGQGDSSALPPLPS